MSETKKTCKDDILAPLISRTVEYLNDDLGIKTDKDDIVIVCPDVLTLKDFISERLEYIEEITIVGEMKTFNSSSLFQLLFSIKKSKPSIKIDGFDEYLKLGDYGTLHWINND